MKVVVTTALCLFLVTVALCQSSQSYELRASFSGGTSNTSSASYVLNGSIGTTVLGAASSASYVTTVGAGNLSTGASADLIFVESNANPASLSPGDDVTITFTIKNNGVVTIASPIVVKAFLSDNTTFEPNTDIELTPSFTVANSLSPNASAVFPSPGAVNQVTIPPGTALKAYQLLLVIDPANSIAEGNETNNVVAKSINVTAATSGGGPDETGPALTDLARPASFSASATLSITATDVSAIQSVFLKYRKMTTSKWDSVPATPDVSRYTVTLQQGMTDDVGIECYFKATDAFGNESESLHVLLYNPVPTNQPIPNLSFGGQPENYRIISVPYDLADNRIDEVFKNMGEYDKTKWRIVRYQGGHNVDKKDGLTKIDRGQAFWFNAIDNADIRIGTGTTVNKDESPDFSMTLEKGYNQVGDPFTFDISWADVLTANHAIAGKLSQQVLVYNSANISLDPSDNLKAWSGGFILADEAVTLSMPVSLKNGGGRMLSTQIVNNNPDLDEWVTGINIQQGDVLNTLVGIGMHPDAKPSKDIYDIITPPRFMEYVGMNTEHNDFFEPKFSRDIVPTATSYNWSFTLESNINSTVAEISWNNSSLRFAKATLLLYDVGQGMLIDMKQSDRYSFDPQRSRSFRFFFGSDPSQIKPDVQEVGQAWPNPAADIVHIPYIVKERSRTQIDVYDMMGRRINKVVDNDQEPGYYTATWDRTSFDGSAVAPGMYLYRMNGSVNVGRIIIN